MLGAQPLPVPSSGSAYEPERELLALTEQISAVVAVAQSLIDSRRHVDLGGLQQQVGLLCAKALDQPPGHTGVVRYALQQLLARLDALHAVMRQNAA